MKNIYLILILILGFLCTNINYLNAQKQDSAWNVKIKRKGAYENSKRTKHMYYDAEGFHLYRNLLYSFTLKNDATIYGLLVDIKEDSLYITNYFNANVAKKNYDTFKILHLHPDELKRMNLIADRALGLTNAINLNNHEFNFYKDTIALSVDTIKCPYYENDTLNNCVACSNCFLSLGNKWVDLIAEKDGNTYYYMGAIDFDSAIDNKLLKKDSIWRKRNFIWVAPVAHNTVINGLTISFLATPLDEWDTLIINGLNAEFGGGMFLMPFLFSGFPDLSLEEYLRTQKGKENCIINGVSASLTGHAANSRINGVSLNGLCGAHIKSNGIIAAFGGCMAGEFNGLMASFVRNKATTGKGLQIGLLNSCKNLKGLQIGLINKNQKRTLPFINWCFKD